jgi:hypothetical protein
MQPRDASKPQYALEQSRDTAMSFGGWIRAVRAARVYRSGQPVRELCARAPYALFGLAVVVAISACSDLTKISNTQVTQPSAFDNPTGALIRRAGAYREFSNAFASQVLYTGLLADELSDSRGVLAVADLRDITPNNQQDGLTFPYPELSTARLEGLRAIASLEQYNPIPRSRIAEMFALVGYVEVFFAEDMCSGVPLANIVGDRPVLGPTLSRSMLLQRALSDFDSAAVNALDSAGNADSTTTRLAAVGHGRALTDSGDLAGAALAVQNVPISFLYATNYDGAVQTNAVAALFTGTVSVSEREGINGLPFVTAADPRVTTDSNPAFPFDGHALYVFRPLESATAPLGLAGGIEASLIRAEARLNAGDITGWTDTLDALRQAAISPPIAALSADSTANAPDSTRTLVMFRERAFWLFLTGHRQGDMRRLVRTTGRSPDNVFPVGQYAGGGGLQYGTSVNFVPFLETGNPNYSGCFDRSP